MNRFIFTFFVAIALLGPEALASLPATSTRVETLTTTYAYDAANRVVQTTDPDGSVTQVVYNEIGKQSATVDKLGRQTTYQYDAAGQLVKTTYPDTTFEEPTGPTNFLTRRCYSVSDKC